MFRFTIRDVLWLTALVALAAGWSVDRNQLRVAWRSDRDQIHAQWQQDHDEFANLLSRLSRSYKMSKHDQQELIEELVSRINAPIPHQQPLPNKK
jgi:hypothetical protein